MKEYDRRFKEFESEVEKGFDGDDEKVQTLFNELRNAAEELKKARSLK